jgi:aerobic-type carbon monoxide dehydrogenase small subunit (CoxS/CutS family)
VKKCSRCETVKAYDEFGKYKSGRKAETYQAYCRACVREYVRSYRLAHPEYVERTIETSRNWREENFRWVERYKLERGCERCGYNTCSRALEAHHVSDKNMNLAVMTRRHSRAKIEAELKKCKILCSNCHREYHSGLFTLE